MLNVCHACFCALLTFIMIKYLWTKRILSYYHNLQIINSNILRICTFKLNKIKLKKQVIQNMIPSNRIIRKYYDILSHKKKIYTLKSKYFILGIIQVSSRYLLIVSLRP